MVNLKRIITVALAFASIMGANAQDNYLNLNAGGGLHTLRHDIKEIGDFDPCFGGTFNFSFVHFFTRHIGLGTGVGASYYQSRSVLDGTYESNQMDEVNGHQAFMFRTTYNGWEEVQRSVNVEVPLGFYFRTDVGQKSEFLLGVGGKLSYPFVYRYEVKEGTIETTGFYPSTNAEIFDLPHHGFRVDDSRYTGKTEALPTFAVYLDLGMNHWFKEKLALYWGLYCNYGITDLSKGHDNLLYDMKSIYNGVHSSTLTDKASLLAAGVKIGITFRIGDKPTDEVLHDTLVIQDTTSMISQLILPEVDSTVVSTGENIDSIAGLISALPDWEHFNYKNKEALQNATNAFASLSDSAKALVDDNLKEKLFNLNRNVAASTIPNLREMLKINKSYGFQFASSDGHFTEDQLKYMRFVADCLKMNPEARVSVIGYTCNIGTEEMNEVFGFDRAIHVKNYLVRFGADEDQIDMDTKTSKCPVAPNTTEANRAKNRRTEIQLIQPK